MALHLSFGALGTKGCNSSWATEGRKKRNRSSTPQHSLASGLCPLYHVPRVFRGIHVVGSISIKQTLGFKQPFVEQVHIHLLFESSLSYHPLVGIASELTFIVVEAQRGQVTFPWSQKLLISKTSRELRTIYLLFITVTCLPAWYVMLLLLSRFSRVRLSVTP